ncbi:MAG: GMP/IMP nucleotidase [Gammaproteobacteria bacterium]|nr:GMP/IMP nucleotidase [Gammaproteobacteria bacterium]
MLNWTNITSVLLDMDGTLLDLHFDNYFWQHHVPQRYAEKNALHIDDARDILFPKFKSAEGTMNWYCVDYWSEQLDLDIEQLKAEVDHLIAVHPHVIEFLESVKAAGKHVALVTNAHHKSLMLKMDRTSLHHHFDDIICAHDFSVPKEDPTFWGKLNKTMVFDKEQTLLVDDTLSVLRSAQEYGIKYLRAVLNPDSQSPQREVEEFKAIKDFRDITPY